jgi:DtxR family transcriptional regulator, Mn-dependent transcriptional regulator
MQSTLTSAEENYLKVIFKISEKDTKSVQTNTIAKYMGTSAASVTDMIKRLAEKDLVHYERYHGVTLTAHGNKWVASVIRRHRLWETFLVQKLRFAWHQVHDIADQLEHIDSDDLITRLDAFLDYPKFDPHGDPIPNAEGRFTIRHQISLSELPVSQTGVLVGVRDDSNIFLKHLNDLGIKLGSTIKVLSKSEYDGSMRIRIDGQSEESISAPTSNLLLIRKGA